MNALKKARPTAEKITKYFRSSPQNFDHIFSKLEVSHLENGSCVGEMVIEEQHTNPMGTLHGGYSAALADAISSIGLSSLEKVKVPHVSVNLNLRYFKSGKLGQRIIIETNTVKCGHSIAYLEIILKDKTTGDILMKGEHTKYLMHPK